MTPTIIPARKLSGTVVTLLTTSAKGRLGFVSTAVTELALDFEGIVGNRHRGWTRKADARVPYLPRGAIMRNERHLSIVSVEDLSEIATRLHLDSLDPAWLGANVVVSGIPQFSHLPRGTRLLFAGGAIATVTDQSPPCTRSGEALALNNPDHQDVKQNFVKRAHGLRGVVAVVEHPGTLTVDTPITARLPIQWLYAQAKS